MKTLIVIPTYNERENIGPMIDAIVGLNRDLSILVVDDSSPDGTGGVVQERSANNPSVNLLTRTKKEGLGKAYVAGFKWGLENGFEVIVEMDADFSHRPQDLLKLLEKMNDCDFAVGSRWVEGGGTVNWGAGRKIISRGGSFYSRCVLGYPIRDWTGGFNAWKVKVLQDIGLDSIKSEGYSFQIELKYRASKKGFKGMEVPIIFEDRRVGESKMSSKIVFEALYKVWMMR